MSHISCRHDKRSAILLVHEEHNQITPSVGLAEGAIDIFTDTMSSFQSAEEGPGCKHLSNLAFEHAVFFSQLVDDVLKPDDTCDAQDDTLSFPP
jgi:hypothetical protein